MDHAGILPDPANASVFCINTLDDGAGIHVAARFDTLSDEQKRVVRMRVAIEIERLSKPASRARSTDEFRAATAAIGRQARRKGLTLLKLRRMIDGSR